MGVPRLAAFFVVALASASASVAQGEATAHPTEQPRCLPPLPREADVTTFVHRPGLAVRHVPDVLLVVLDTLRADRVDAEHMPRLYRWFEGAHRAERTLAAATSTDHSLFASFFLRPATEREATFAAGWSSGSPALQTARAVGYEVNLFAYPSWYPRPQAPLHKPHPGPWSNRATFELLYGKDGHLLRQRLPAPPLVLEERQPFLADRALVEQLLADIDAASDIASDAAPQTASASVSGRTPRLDILHLYGLHDPYGVDTQAPGLRLPYLDGAPGARPVPPRSRVADADTRQRLRNTYDNAALSLDRNLQLLFDALEQRETPAGRLVVVLSDHGECFPDDAEERYGHGFAPSRAQEEVVMGFRGGPAPPFEGGPRAATASTADVFATLFAWLGLHDEVDSALQLPAWPAPLSPNAPVCHLTVQPRQAWPPVVFAVNDGACRATLRVQRPTLDGAAQEITLVNVTSTQAGDAAAAGSVPCSVERLLQCLPPCAAWAAPAGADGVAPAPATP